MYAVIETGGKQYKVTEEQVIKIEKLEQAVGDKVEFDKVLLVNKDSKSKIGTPHVNGSKVTATVLSHGRDKKVNIIKFRRRKHSQSQMGHRQWFTELKIENIKA